MRLENQSGEATLIHWHGLKPPYRQDGVPQISAPLIATGEAADYDFPLAFPGTFWMHSHQGLQEQQLMAAPLIVRDASGAADHEIVMMLHDFSFTSPQEILVAVDGHPIQPVDGSEFLIATAQRLDVRLQLPKERRVLELDDEIY